MGVLFIIILCLLACLAWLIFSPVVLEIDTKVPVVKLNWNTIGNAALWFEHDEWILRYRVLFYSRQMLIKDIKTTPAKKNAKPKKKSQKTPDVKTIFKKILHVIKSFRVVEYTAALDTGDFCYNALLYPLNYLVPNAHCNINFNDDSWLMAKISNNGFRALRAWLQ